MNRKTVFRNLAILALILLALWGWSVLRDSDREYTAVDTSVALAELNGKSNVDKVQIDDKQQQLRIELKNGTGATEGDEHFCDASLDDVACRANHSRIVTACSLCFQLAAVGAGELAEL